MDQFLESLKNELKQEAIAEARAAAREEFNRLYTESIPKVEEEEKYISRKDLAARLGVTEMTIIRKTANGTIGAHRFGRRVLYLWSEIEPTLISTQV